MVLFCWGSFEKCKRLTSTTTSPLLVEESLVTDAILTTKGEFASPKCHRNSETEEEMKHQEATDIKEVALTMLPPKKQKKPYAVRFSSTNSYHNESKRDCYDEEDDDDLSVDEVYIEPTHQISERIMFECWWSKDELDENGSSRRQAVHEFLEEQEQQYEADDEQRGFNALRKRCLNTTLEEILEEETTRELFSLMGNVEGLRGLEARVFREKKEQRKNHVQVCLEAQGDPEQFCKVSQQSSRGSFVLARVFAEMDQREAL